MSRLKISDLSFCETELTCNSKVQGGLTISLLPLSGESPIFSTESDSLETDYYTDKTPGVTKYLVRDKSSKKIVGVGLSANTTLDDGTKISTSMAASGNDLLLS